MISQRHKENRIDLGVDEILPAGDKAERADAAGENWDRLFGISSLGRDLNCENETQ
jgi:hypothetical protein